VFALDVPYCPAAARFIDTLVEARVYYRWRLVEQGPFEVTVGNRTCRVYFNHEEIHPFTTEVSSPGAEQVARGGRSGEIRYFDRLRARRLDDILPTLRNPARVVQAKSLRGVCVYGPPERGSPRLCVVVVSDHRSSDRWYVRTAYPVAADDFGRVVARREKPIRWPP